MIRYTVVYTHAGRDDLARVWLDASNRQAVATAADRIDRQLRYDASKQGEELREGLRIVTVLPLRVHFTVEEDDRTVTVWSVGYVAGSRD